MCVPISFKYVYELYNMYECVYMKIRMGVDLKVLVRTVYYKGRQCYETARELFILSSRK